VKTFGVITPPGFSDWLNDPQPTWDDVTFYRLFLDHPDVAKPFVGDDQPPYVLFDVIKASRFPGSKPNGNFGTIYQAFLRTTLRDLTLTVHALTWATLCPKN